MKTQLLLLATLISFNAYSVTIKTNETFVPAVTSDSKKISVPKSMVISGILNIVDLNAKFIMVNNETFKVSKDLKVYDGKLESKKNIRFLLSPENEVIEIWVQK